MALAHQVEAHQVEARQVEARQADGGMDIMEDP